MTPEVNALRICAQDAALAASRGITSPSLCSVLVDVGDSPSGPVPVAFQFGFQQLLTGWGLGPRLKACFVEVRLQPRAIAVISSGTYGRSQFKTLASIPGADFPPPTLDLNLLRVGPLQVLDVIRARPLSAASADIGDVRFRTLLLDAADAHVLFEKIDAGVVP